MRTYVGPGAAAAAADLDGDIHASAGRESLTPFLDDLKAFLPVPVKGLARPMAPIPSSSSLSSATAPMARSLALVTGEKSSLVGAKPAGEPRSATPGERKVLSRLRTADDAATDGVRERGDRGRGHRGGVGRLLRVRGDGLSPRPRRGVVVHHRVRSAISRDGTRGPARVREKRVGVRSLHLALLDDGVGDRRSHGAVAGAAAEHGEEPAVRGERRVLDPPAAAAAAGAMATGRQPRRRQPRPRRSRPRRARCARRPSPRAPSPCARRR